MRIESRDRLPYPVMDVYCAVRDHQVDFVIFMPDVLDIKVVEREELAGNQLRLLSHWHGATKIPSLLKKIVNPEMMSWKDHALWHDDELFVEWHLETFYQQDLFRCRGRTTFMESGERKTEMVLEANLEVNASAIPGVPSFLGSKISLQVEAFIAKLISPNLNNLAKGVRAYLDAGNR